MRPWPRWNASSATSVTSTGRCQGRCERIVRGDVRAPEPVIEEACQFAWSRLVYHQHRVHRETALGWLAQDREPGGDQAAFGAAAVSCRSIPRRPPRAAPRLMVDPGPAELVERRARLATLATLPLRQQRLLWLRGLGLSYEEIARTRRMHRADGRAPAEPRAAPRSARSPADRSAPPSRYGRAEAALPRLSALAPPALRRAQLARLDRALGARAAADARGRRGRGATGARRRASRQMKNEIPPISTSAPIAIAIARRAAERRCRWPTRSSWG